jgi:hypothetical protein
VNPPTIFLLSPANMGGTRAKQISSPRAKFAAAVALRSQAGVAIEEAYAFMSALYFRGKIAYAQKFAAPPSSLEHGVFIIAPGFGLVTPGWSLDMTRFKKIKTIDVDLRSRAYRKPLETHARELAEKLPLDARVVLLGSIATGKYVDILWPIFGDRLRFPRCFVGIGDMSRGSIMLKAAASGQELEYATLDIERHRPRGVTEREVNLQRGDAS